MKISGHVDLCGPDLIEGWLYCDAWDGQPIKLQVFVGSDLLGECVVDRYRNDLQEAGFGDGRCGFSFFVPPALATSDFADTRLRLVDTPVFLLPDEFSTIAHPTDRATGLLSNLDKSVSYADRLRKEAPDSEAGNQPAKHRPSERGLQHTR